MSDRTTSNPAASNPAASNPAASGDTTFAGKTAIVTGAASGIGRALAEALVRRGATVTVADIDKAGAEEAAQEIAARHSGRVEPCALDVTDAAAFAALAEAVRHDHGAVDFLFNNAGIGVGGRVEELTLAHWERAIDVNLRGVVHGVAAVYPDMIRRGSGHIVNTASLAGLLPGPMLTPYAATKHAVVGLSTSLRGEAASRGVRVSVVCPGVIDTPLLDKANPPDLPQVDMANTRAMLTKAIGKPYPPSSLAEDVLVGVAANRGYIVAPRHARVPWRIFRLSPELFLRTMPAGLRRITRALGS
ncbi:MAG: SDR family NAD(P)-dependent oxidoreductase [Acidimicrobiales bacterium]